MKLSEELNNDANWLKIYPEDKNNIESVAKKLQNNAAKVEQIEKYCLEVAEWMSNIWPFFGSNRTEHITKLRQIAIGIFEEKTPS